MTDLNHIIITGNLAHDIGEKDVQKAGETTKLTISVANNKSVKVGSEWKNEVNFFDVVLWGKLADNLIPYLHKGKSVAIDGRLDQDRWEKDGQKRSKIYITANAVKLTGGKPESDSASAAEGKQESLDFKEDPVF